MSDITATLTSSSDSDDRPRFVNGGKPGPGRPRGSRSRLGEEFLQALRETWQKHGAEALERAATSDPVAFTKIIASLMPQEVAVGPISDFGACQSVRDVTELLLDEAGDLHGLIAWCDEVRAAAIERLAEQALPAPE